MPPMLRGYGFDEAFIRHVLSHRVQPAQPGGAHPPHGKSPLHSGRALRVYHRLCLGTPTESVLDLEVKSVKKKFKQDSFAAAVNRGVIQDGADRMGMPLEEVMAETILGLREAADALDLGMHSAQ